MAVLQPLTYPSGSRVLPGIHDNVSCYASVASVINIYWKDGISTSMNLGQGVTRAFKLRTIDDKMGIQVISGSINVVFDYQDEGSLFDVVYALYGTNSPPQTAPEYDDTLLRSLEHSPPRGSNIGANPAPQLDESVAAGASGSVASVGLSGSRGPMLIVSMGIDQISNGSTPTESYIYLLEGSGSGVGNSNIIASVKGAVVPWLTGKFILPLASGTAKYQIAYKNGDTAAHWFYCQVYPVNA